MTTTKTPTTFEYVLLDATEIEAAYEEFTEWLNHTGETGFTSTRLVWLNGSYAMELAIPL